MRLLHGLAKIAHAAVVGAGNLLHGSDQQSCSLVNGRVRVAAGGQVKVSVPR